tara:strand:- start:403 stop:726 length:324 start_codon:yes stop_codon:yes gene_type:complete
MGHIKITEKQLKKVLNEVIGFTTSYEDEAMDELKSLVNVMKGPIENYIKTKSIGSDDVVSQRIYQLVTEGGELHTLVQELIDLLESLPEKPKPGSNKIGFKVKGVNS